jgi:hypothetical protein
MKQSERSFHRIWLKAESYPAKVTPDEIRRLSLSKDGHERVLSLFLMRRRIAAGDAATTYLPRARQMIRDSDGNCRWQATIVVGESIKIDPDAVWQVVLEHGDSEDDDLRRAIACVLLEHLFESDFERYFSLLRDEVSRGRRRFLDTLENCWLFGAGAGDREKKIAKYIRKATRGLSRSS